MISADDITVGNERFNAEQKEAVESVFGTFMVAAPPGSGKTFVLQKRILFMALKHHIDTRKILAITFTNEAAKEMERRISAELKRFNIENNATISTFHSFALKMLKKYRKEKFTLITEDDQLKIIKKILLKLEVNKEDLIPKEALKMISDLKSRGKHWYDVNQELETQKAEISKYIANPELAEKDGIDQHEIIFMKGEFNKKITELQIYAQYEAFKGDKLYDFDDLILGLRDILKNNKIRKAISEEFKFILVDETQDIDPLQEEIIRLLVDFGGDLFCIYDDDQSIYGFRNADPSLVMNLDRKIKGTKVITLKENFRSTDSIIQASNHVIKNNRMRIKKWMKTNNEEGEKVAYKCLQSKEAEAEFICDKIEELREIHGYTYKDFAVLYRNNELNKVVEQKMLAREIPHKINKTISFFERIEIKDMLGYLNFIVSTPGPDSDFLLEKIINVPKRGVGEKALIEYRRAAFNVPSDTYTYIRRSQNMRAEIVEFCDIIDEARIMLKEEKTLVEIMNFILDKTNYFEKNFKEEERETRKQNVERLEEILNRLTEEYETPEEILCQLVLNQSDEPNCVEGKVSLMTMHASKGRGFNVVFIIGCEQGIIPSYNCLNDYNLLEEERRIMYVAMTRAKKHCFISRAKFRLNQTAGGVRETKLSQFVNEIPDELIEWDQDEIMLM